MEHVRVARSCSACWGASSTKTSARWWRHGRCSWSPGTEDDLFPFATAAESVRRTRLVYEQLGAGDRLEHDIFEGGHQWHGTEAMPFLDRWLGHSPD